MTSRFKLCLALSAALLASTAEAASTPAPEALTPLLNAIGERLALADQVALSKWDSHKAVEDRQREREVIAAAVAQAPTYKLSGETVEAFSPPKLKPTKWCSTSTCPTGPWTARPGPPTPGPGGTDPPATRSTAKTPAATTGRLRPYRTDPQCPQWLAQATHHNKQHPVHRLALIRATGELCISTKS